MVDIAYELEQRDMRELADYDRIVAALGDHTLAARTAEKVQEKIIERKVTR